MQCQQATELYSDYVERALDPALTVSVDNHLAACAVCREEVSALRRVWANLEQMPVQEPPAALHANILNALDAHLEAERREQAPARAAGNIWDWRLLFRPRVLAYAATLLILILGSVELVQSQRAALGPLGALMRMLHPQADVPAPTPPAALRVTHSEMTTDQAGKATLVLTVTSDAGSVSALNGLAYRAELTQNRADAPSGERLADMRGHFNAVGVAALSLPLEHGVTGEKAQLRLSFQSPNGTPSAQPDMIVPVEWHSGAK